MSEVSDGHGNGIHFGPGQQWGESGALDRGEAGAGILWVEDGGKALGRNPDVSLHGVRVPGVLRERSGVEGRSGRGESCATNVLGI